MNLQLDGKIALVTGSTAGIGTEHAAHPRGEARILVIEKAGSE